MRAWTVLTFLALSAVLLVGGCRSNNPLVLRKILVDLEPSAVLELDREQVRGVLRNALAADPGFTVDESAVTGAVLRLTVFMATPGAAEHAGKEGGGHPALVSLGVDVNGESGTRRVSYHGKGSATGENTAADDEVLKGLVVKAVQGALAEIGSVRDLEDASDDDLLKIAADENARASRREHAVRALGSRRVEAAVPVLVRMLEDGPRDLADTALGALAGIGAADAVDAVIAYASGKPSLVRRQAIEAVRAMGSKKGEAWLFTLSTGHPDPEVQLAASSALASLAARHGEDDASQVQ